MTAILRVDKPGRVAACKYYAWFQFEDLWFLLTHNTIVDNCLECPLSETKVIKDDYLRINETRQTGDDYFEHEIVAFSMSSQSRDSLIELSDRTWPSMEQQ